MKQVQNGTLEGVIIKELTRHCDERGYLLEVVRDDDGLMERFGQTTYTMTYPGVIKAFHWHSIQYDLWYVAHGEAMVVLHDLREDSPSYKQTQVIYTGEHTPKLIVIPPRVAHGYRVLGDKPIGLFYHTTRSYDPGSPDEERLPYDDPSINFPW
ncbi:MAG: spore coat protein [Candidatus Solincola sediminis]|uniref:Spore coat protein n=1 Tax=Candidatus Solincola sediminis TaxID=1797199 RepID=A0A1F2WJ54_9ACTN|nr:MAG: spore coat protein [Candidatus Solincola sediminis]OFW57554.1 MAG: spore coat protein [Candidatus Solincola sediminis]